MSPFFRNGDDQDASAMIYAGTPCVLFQGARTHNGYGRKKHKGRVVPAHRWAWEAAVGAIPPGMVLDHLCRNRACINIEHLEVVTERENILRGIGPTAVNARKTHCKRGHPLSGDNLRLLPDGRRACRICKKASEDACHAKRPLLTGVRRTRKDLPVPEVKS